MGKDDASIRVPRATYATMVGERIRSSILEGTMPPGSQLSEVELASHFGVSRGPVREALQRLIQEGLLRSEPHRGVFVPVMSAEDIDDIYLVREALETAAIRRIVGTSRSIPAYKALDHVVRKMREAEKAGDWKAVADLDLEYHTALVAAADSPRLQRIFTTVISETRLCMSVLAGAYDARHDLVYDHLRIVDFMRDNDAERALAALKKHFDDAVITLKRQRADVSGAAGQ
jgi:DNA-binding GntR family transcriptional regulator